MKKDRPAHRRAVFLRHDTPPHRGTVVLIRSSSMTTTCRLPARSRQRSVALAPDVMLAHGVGPVECCKTFFGAQNNNIDSVMNAGTHRFTYRKQRECRFGH